MKKYIDEMDRMSDEMTALNARLNRLRDKLQVFYEMNEFIGTIEKIKDYIEAYGARTFRYKLDSEYNLHITPKLSKLFYFDLELVETGEIYKHFDVILTEEELLHTFTHKNGGFSLIVGLMEEIKCDFDNYIFERMEIY